LSGATAYYAARISTYSTLEDGSGIGWPSSRSPSRWNSIASWINCNTSSFVAASGCNGCHAGPAGEYASGGDPFLGEPKQINQAAYLAGGTPLFGPFFLPRNLTPDKTGRPEGGASFEEFRDIMRTGIDPDQAHLQFGPYLQVMPWPNF
jgi:hypothetical protein